MQPLLKQGAAITGLGVLLVGYALTVEVLPLVPPIPGAPRELRIIIFAIGIVAIGLGISIVLDILETDQIENHA